MHISKKAFIMLVVWGFLLVSFVVSMWWGVRWTSGGQKYTIILSGGTMTHITHHWLSDGGPPPRHYMSRPDPSGLSCFRHDGELVGWPWNPGKSGVAVGGFPLLLPLIVIAFLLVPTAISLLNARLDESRQMGLCVKCGFDLRASKDRCPECGTEFATSEPPQNSP
jgi:hypothetical protein